MEKLTTIMETIKENQSTLSATENGRMVLLIMKDNAKVALFHEKFPLLLDILKKYNGKPMGEKTYKKVKDEVLKVTNCIFYFNKQNSIVMYPMECFGNNYSIEVGIKSKTGAIPFLNNNKIDIDNITMEDIELRYMNDEYVDDVWERVDKIFRIKQEAIIIQEKLRSVCSMYNSYIPSDAECLNYSKHLY